LQEPEEQAKNKEAWDGQQQIDEVGIAGNIYKPWARGARASKEINGAQFGLVSCGRWADTAIGEGDGRLLEADESLLVVVAGLLGKIKKCGRVMKADKHVLALFVDVVVCCNMIENVSSGRGLTKSRINQTKKRRTNLCSKRSHGNG
jgi:hypothetical protein